MSSNPRVAAAAQFVSAPVELPPCLLVFVLDGLRCAWPLSAVERIVLAGSITPFPGAPPSVCGLVEYAGRRLPVLNLRQRLGLAPRPLSLGVTFLIARVGLRRVALAIDGVTEIIEQPLAVPVADGPFEHVPGVVCCECGLVVIDDPECLLSADDELALSDALGGLH